MNTPLRVLLVEDSKADAELTLLELRHGGFAPDYERVDTPEAMQSALERRDWEIILSDYVMPRFSGPAALKLLQESGLDIPIIMVTGQVGEETAVETMRAGAHDYVLKGNLTRLGPAIQRELREAEARRERRQVEQSMRLNLERYQRLADTASRLLVSDKPQEMVEELCQRVMEYLDCHAFFNFLVDERAGRLRLNACAGVPDEEVKNLRWLDFGVAVCGYVAQNGHRVVAENIPTTHDPRTDLVASYGIRAYCCHPLIGSGDKVFGTLSFGTRSRDTFSDDDVELMRKVTDYVAIAMQRIQTVTALRDSEARLRIATKVAGLGIHDYDIASGTIEWDEQVRGLWGVGPDTVVTFDVFMAGVNPDDRAKLKAAMERAFSPEGTGEFYAEYRVIGLGNQKERWVSARGSVFFEEGQAVRLVNTIQDITEQKQIEAEREQLLAEVQRRAAELVSGITDPTHSPNLSAAT